MMAGKRQRLPNEKALGIHGEGGILIASFAIAAMLVRLASFRRRDRR
ncbi:MAG: hypothetical protein VB141_09070 [Burkholderia gladioli]